jgi:hypothetical protein
MDEGCEVLVEDRVDIGSSNSPQMKMMSLIYNEKEWTAYIGIMMKSEICGIELFARMIVQNDVGDENSRLPTLPEVVDEQHIECGTMLTQSSQET